MQTGQRIYRECQKCLGDGKLWRGANTTLLHSNPDPAAEVGEDVVCPICNGTGIVTWGWLRDEKETTMPGEEA